MEINFIRVEASEEARRATSETAWAELAGELVEQVAEFVALFLEL